MCADRLLNFELSLHWSNSTTSKLTTPTVPLLNLLGLSGFAITRNNEGLKLFEVKFRTLIVVLVNNLNHEDVIVYLNFSTIWHLCKFLCNVGAGWMLQINANSMYKVCCRAVAVFVLGVNSQFCSWYQQSGMLGRNSRG